MKNALRVATAQVILCDVPRLILRLCGSDDIELSFPLARIKSFRRRTEPRRALDNGSETLKAVVVEDAGGTIEWPDLDVSFSVAEMLPEFLGLGGIARSANARKAGSTKTPAKARASRANGKLGGRPSKVA